MMLIALMVQLSGVVLLYRSWHKPQRQRLANLVRWVVLIAALWLWKRAMGWEFGTALWFFITPFVAWILTVHGREFRELNAPDRSRLLIRPEKKRVLQNILKIFIAGPIAFMASFVLATLMSLAFARVTGLAESTQPILSLVFLILFWITAIYRVSANPARWKPTSILLFIAASGPIMLYGIAL